MNFEYNLHISVVIVTYNANRWVEKCFGSLRNSTCPISVIVVDNGSVDGCQDRIKLTYPEVILIQSSSNLGFGKANNIGILRAFEAGADYVFLLNQDAWIEPSTIEDLVRIHQANPGFGVLSPMHLNGKRSALDMNFSNYLVPMSCPGLYSDIYTNSVKEVYRVNFINAAAWLLSRNCIGKVGVFDPLFFHYGEDRNYCQRVMYHGLSIGVCPFIRIAHDRNQSGGVDSSFRGRIENERELLVSLADVTPGNRFRFRNLFFRTLIECAKEILTLQLSNVAEHVSLLIRLLKKKDAISESLKRNREEYLKSY